MSRNTLVIFVKHTFIKTYNFHRFLPTPGYNCQRLLTSGVKVFGLQRSQIDNLKSESIDIEEKIVYNSKIKFDMSVWKNARKETLNRNNELKEQNSPPILALKYFGITEKDLANDKTVKEENEAVHLPYQTHSVDIQQVESHYKSPNIELVDNVSFINQDGNHTLTNLKDKLCMDRNRDWMKDYNKYIEVSVKKFDKESEDEIDDSWSLNYGSADPKISSSKVPCGGCGAHLHCQDHAIPGYLPREIFTGLDETQLQAVVCQRCHFLREYDTALSVSVDPQIYPQLLSQIRSETALVLLVVDMTDFPCSIWPGILDVIGPKRPLIVVGNKIDLLQDWSKDWLEMAKKALVSQLPAKANVVHTTLISAKTGYGVEELITTLYNCWEYRGDVYLVGCTNVGKSTLFNALLQSDYCKAKAVDLIQRATTAPWPGTTLNLLKFPIMRPEGRRLAMRTLRLREQSAQQLKQVQVSKLAGAPQMISYIDRTFAAGNTNKYNDDYYDDPFAMPKLGTLRKIRASGSGLDPSDPDFVNSKWLYDTPGVITPDQIIELLTTEELMLTLPRQPIVPRSFTVWAGQSLLIGGLARVDFISGPNNIKMTVLAAFTLPVTICFTADVEEVYQHYLGSDVLAVPQGGEQRLGLWPGLHAGPQFSFKGEGWKHSCADVVLSSAGWVAMTALEDTINQLQAYTPNARGIHVRVPPVLPRAIAVKGRRMFKSQAYALYNEHITGHPPKSRRR